MLWTGCHPEQLITKQNTYGRKAYLHSSNHAMLANIEQGTNTYFVHSYYYQQLPPEYPLQQQIIVMKSWIIGKDNIIATQFHLEKSQAGQNS